MKRKKKIKKDKKMLDEQDINIDNLIDDMAYLNEGQNIKKSKNLLDNMYLLNE
jgi:hypothetical protein